jgi:mono/diheme cytochrome c family protein
MTCSRALARALALAAALVAPAGAETPARDLPADVGAELFARYCSACHGASGVGDGPAARALVKPPADLTRIAARRGGTFPDGEIAHWIDGRFDVPSHGTREMPIWGRRLAEPIAEDTTGEEVARGKIDLLVDYLKTLQVPAAPAKD